MQGCIPTVRRTRYPHNRMFAIEDLDNDAMPWTHHNESRRKIAVPFAPLEAYMSTQTLEQRTEKTGTKNIADAKAGPTGKNKSGQLVNKERRQVVWALIG